MAQNLGALVAAEIAVVVAMDARDGADLVQSLAVDRELVQAAVALPDLERRQAQLEADSPTSSVSIRRWPGPPAMCPACV